MRIKMRRRSNSEHGNFCGSANCLSSQYHLQSVLVHINEFVHA